MYLWQNIQHYDSETEMVDFRSIVVMYSDFALAFQVVSRQKSPFISLLFCSS